MAHSVSAVPPLAAGYLYVRRPRVNAMRRYRESQPLRSGRARSHRDGCAGPRLRDVDPRPAGYPRSGQRTIGGARSAVHWRVLRVCAGADQRHGGRTRIPRGLSTHATVLQPAGPAEYRSAGSQVGAGTGFARAGGVGALRYEENAKLSSFRIAAAPDPHLHGRPCTLGCHSCTLRQ